MNIQSPPIETFRFHIPLLIVMLHSPHRLKHHFSTPIVFQDLFNIFLFIPFLRHKCLQIVQYLLIMEDFFSDRTFIMHFQIQTLLLRILSPYGEEMPHLIGDA